jgi:hypothetical protein
MQSGHPDSDKSLPNPGMVTGKCRKS